MLWKLFKRMDPADLPPLNPAPVGEPSPLAKRIAELLRERPHDWTRHNIGYSSGAKHVSGVRVAYEPYSQLSVSSGDDFTVLRKADFTCAYNALCEWQRWRSKQAQQNITDALNWEDHGE